MAIQGFIDWCIPELVLGWARDSDNPDRRIKIEIYSGNVCIGTGKAEHYRKDLQGAGFGDGCYGFVFQGSPLLPPNGKGNVTIVADRHVVLPASNKSVRSSPPFFTTSVKAIPSEIHAAYQPIYGYYISSSELPVSITVNRQALPVDQDDRPDLTRTLSNSVGRGFYAIYSVAEDDRFLEIVIEIDGIEMHRQTVSVADAGRANSIASATARDASRAFVFRNLSCPVCSSSLAGSGQPEGCTQCGTAFVQGTSAVSVVPAGIGVPKAINTSLFGYGPEESDLLNAARRSGGVILDFGAGLRPCRDPTVVTLETADMPSTDVISFSNKIPFADNTFDGAITLHVLEHVKEPWVVASELLRVVKPGAPIISTVPYVCPVHGFPYHFFNMTPEGLRSLFESATFVSHTLKRDGHPINGIRLLLQEFYGGFADTVQQKNFGDMRIRDLIEAPLEGLLSTEWVTSYPDQTRWYLPTHSTLVVRKPHADET